jgi:hypothetical protein
MNQRQGISTLLNITLGATLLATLSVASEASAQAPALKSALDCAPRVGGVPANAFRVLGAQDTVARSLFGARDLVIVNGGTAQRLQLGQQFTIRRASMWTSRRVVGPHAINTVGRLHIVAANDATAIAAIDLACDGILVGDYLEPYAELVLPPGAERADTSGELDFSAAGHVLFGDDGRATAGRGDFMIADIGSKRGATPGARYAVYRDLHLYGVPLESVGEALVVLTDADTSVVRLTLSRDAIQSGDLLIRRKP